MMIPQVRVDYWQAGDQIDENFIFIPVLLFNTVATVYYVKLCKNIQRRVKCPAKMGNIFTKLEGPCCDS